MLPRRSSSVCIFTAALVVRKCAHGKTDRHRAMVVESRARYWSGPTPGRRTASSAAGPTPHGYASRAFRWHRPASSAGPAGGSPCDRVSMRGPRGGRSAGRRPWTGISGKRPDPVIAAIPVDDPRESSPWQEVHELSEQGLAGVHEHLLGETPKSAPSNSNRHHAFSLQTPQKSWLSKPAPLS